MGIEKGTVNFTSDTHLLEELGERLVASPAVAIAELIKNGYDADAVKCQVWQTLDRKSIVVEDDGHGITKDEFLSRWMTVATQHKRENPQSRGFSRTLTGAKGVGRFAARFLGKSLKLVSHAYDSEAKAHARLEATFDWTSFDAGGALTEIQIPYTYEIGTTKKHGTRLEISALRVKWDEKTESRVRREVLGICSPFPSLDSGEELKREKGDPGFSVLFSTPGAVTKAEADVASEALDRYLARLTISRRDGKIEYRIRFRDGGPEKVFRHPASVDLLGPLNADIRYMPRGKGHFSEFEHLSGKDVYQWVQENSGVRIFDHGFRVPPYGEKDDDWLRLAVDSGSNRRQWRSKVAEALFPRADLDKDESRDPALWLPGNHQVLGAVFLNTDQALDATHDKSAADRLQVAMDRQGYLANEGYNQLVDIVRGGLELLAVVCKERDIKQKEEAAKAEADRVRKSFRTAIVDVEKAPIPAKEKKKLVRTFQRLEKQVHGLDVAHVRARESIELMGLLGGLAGFMTHETRTLLKTVDQLLKLLGDGNLTNKDIPLITTKARQAHQQLDDQLNYAQTFLTGIDQKRVEKLYAHEQAKLVIDKMTSFAEPRSIETINNISKKLLTAPTMAVVYGGILMNLYTNAIKAVLSLRGASKKVVQFDASNDDEFHIVRVSDTGIGIPDAIQDRIFDPLFSTTKDSPLGSGMGLGLSIVKRLVEDLGGEIRVARAEKGFSTTFEVKLPLKRK